jgi:hypothetical protein
MVIGASIIVVARRLLGIARTISLCSYLHPRLILIVDLQMMFNRLGVCDSSKSTMSRGDTNRNLEIYCRLRRQGKICSMFLFQYLPNLVSISVKVMPICSIKVTVSGIIFSRPFDSASDHQDCPGENIWCCVSLCT